MRCIVDIETDGFVDNVQTFHCIVAKDIQTNKVFHLFKTNVTPNFLSSLNK